MSLARLALRLAAVEALNPYATIATGPWPTIAGPRVFDSRIDLLSESELADIEGSPIVIVYTEKDDSRPYEGSRLPQYEQVCELAVELMIAAAGTVQVEQADGSLKTVGALTTPITNRQHEALLDVLEALVKRVLDPNSQAPSAATLFKAVAMEIRHIESVPQRADDRVTRLAGRTLCFMVKVKTDAWPVSTMVSPAPTGFGLFPKPLQDVANLLPPGSSGYAVCTEMAPLITQPVTLPALDDIRVFANINRTYAPTQTDGSDSDVVADVEFSS